MEWLFYVDPPLTITDLSNTAYPKACVCSNRQETNSNSLGGWCRSIDAASQAAPGTKQDSSLSRQLNHKNTAMIRRIRFVKVSHFQIEILFDVIFQQIDLN